MPLSILIVTKNAEDVVGDAFASLQRVGDEFVVVDSGSTDGTVAVVQKFTRNVYVYPFQQDFSKLRNFGLSKVAGDWVLALDADERLSEESKREIPDLIGSKTIDGYWFRRKTFIAPDRYLRHGLFYPDWQLRLFRKRKEYYYRGTVHEQLMIPKDKTKEVQCDILHYPQHPKYTSFTDFRNLMPYVRIHANELEKSNKAVSTLLFAAIGQFIQLFFSGFFRGKGFLDGWAGFRAHLLFASSVSLAHVLAGWKKVKRTFIL